MAAGLAAFRMRACHWPPGLACNPAGSSYVTCASCLQYGDIWVFEKDVQTNGWDDDAHGHGHGHGHAH